MRYIYTFTLKARNDLKVCTDLRVVIGMFHRVELVYFEEEFNIFRENCNKDGFELHKIERVPFHIPEIII